MRKRVTIKKWSETKTMTRLNAEARSNLWTNQETILKWRRKTYYTKLDLFIRQNSSNTDVTQLE